MQLSKYCDGLLRKTSRSLSEAELEEKFNEVIAIFSYVEDKDVFQRVGGGNALKYVHTFLIMCRFTMVIFSVFLCDVFTIHCVFTVFLFCDHILT